MTLAVLHIRGLFYLSPRPAVPFLAEPSISPQKHSTENTGHEDEDTGGEQQNERQAGARGKIRDLCAQLTFRALFPRKSELRPRGGLVKSGILLWVGVPSVFPSGIAGGKRRYF